MISNYEFNSLSDTQKAEVTWAGTFIDTRFEKDFKILLYRVNDFYVEVYYNDVDNKICRFRSFKTLKLLAPYIVLS